MATPVTRYAKSGDVHVAYQVFGSGSIDLVFAPGFISHIEHYWDHPDLARWLLRLGSFARVVIFDKRGTGLSDSVPEVPSLEQRMDDVRAVMDTVGIESAAQLGISEGGALATLFAATYPERCQRLVLYGAFARSPINADALKPYLNYVDRDWGSGRSLPIWAPSRRDDPTLQAMVGPLRATGRKSISCHGSGADGLSNRHHRHLVLGPCANADNSLHRRHTHQCGLRTLSCPTHSRGSIDRTARRGSPFLRP